MLGYDWPRLHAALNDLPAALLLAAIAFELLGAMTRRDSLKAAGYWCLMVGVVGTALAAGAGLMAASRIEHSDRAHDLMETHETLSLVVLGIFAVLALWRLVRRVLGPREQTAYLTAGAIGLGLLIVTSKIGGSLVFDHGLGIRSATMQELIEEREHGHRHEGGVAHEHAPGEEREHGAPDSAAAAPDTGKAAAAETTRTSRTHTHADGTTHTH